MVRAISSIGEEGCNKLKNFFESNFDSYKAVCLWINLFIHGHTAFFKEEAA